MSLCTAVAAPTCRARVSRDIRAVLQMQAANTREAFPALHSPPGPPRQRSPARTMKPGGSRRSSWLVGKLARLTVQPLLGGGESAEARDRCAQIDGLPFGVEARDLELVDPTEEV